MPDIRLYPTSYAGRPQEVRLVVAVSCCLSAAGIRFLGLPVPAEGFRFSRDRPTLTARCWDLDGVSMFRTNEIRVGPGASCAPGLRCSHSRRSCFDCRCRFSAASPALRYFSHLPELPITKPHQRFTLIHPSTLPLACSPRTGRRPLGFSPRLRTPQLPVTHARAGTGTEHLPELRSQPTSTSYPRNPLVSCDLTSHGFHPVVGVDVRAVPSTGGKLIEYMRIDRRLVVVTPPG
jgi:hypothetical protein